MLIEGLQLHLRRSGDLGHRLALVAKERPPATWERVWEPEFAKPRVIGGHRPLGRLPNGAKHRDIGISLNILDIATESKYFSQ